MKKILLTILCAVNSINGISQIANFVWAKAIGGTSFSAGNSVKVDASGNVYTTGYFTGITDFDPSAATFTLSSFGGSYDAFISKLDAAGNFVWAKQLGGAFNDDGLSIALDASGNIYTTGVFRETADFDPGVGTFTLASTAVGDVDIFVSKLDASGNFVWAKHLGGGSFDEARSIHVDAVGNIYTTGSFNGIADFDPGATTFNLNAVGMGDIFISKLDAAGNFVWAKRMGGTSSQEGRSISVDASGNVYTAGYFYGVADFDPGVGTYTLSSVGLSDDAFVSKLDASGNFVWAVQLGDLASDYANSIAVDAMGDIIVAGSFAATTDFDPSASTYTLSSLGNSDGFFLKLSASGTFIWAKQIGGSTTVTTAKSIAVDPVGGLYATGFLDGTADFDPGAGSFTLASNGLKDVFILKLNAGGTFVWAKQFGSIVNDQGFAVVVDASDNVYTTGSFAGTVDFDPSPTGTFTLTSAWNGDVFIHKMLQCEAPLPPNNTTPLANQIICSNNAAVLMVTGAGTINWYTSPTSTLSTGAGTTYTTSLLSEGIYTYYAEAFSCAASILRTAITVTVSACTGLSDLKNAKNLMLNIYPNPSNGIFQIDAEEMNGLTITDAIGTIVLKQKVTSGKNAIDLSNCANGIYFLQMLKDGEVECTHKIVKQ